ncbi:MAG TPA: threonine-phosphate decarboxylase CobD [Dissulfurispiraceae bacterium]|nr:threonine-phosphate decarboxylase CobD [Dissulfurispiraceae bacterium]
MHGAHGGNIYRAAGRSGLDEHEIIDFSASINPLGVPKSVLAGIRDTMKYLNNYPDPDAREFTLALANNFAINPELILCGNGSTELIYLVIRALMPQKILIPAPTFSEYELAAGDGREVVPYALNAENNFAINPDTFIKAMAKDSNSLSYRMALRTSIDMAFLCNPNNPTGGIIRRTDMLKISEAAKYLRCHLVVDEAFIDFSPEDSLINEVEDNPYLIVLRSLTKFYALSGLRVGYGVFPLKLIDVMKKHKEPWTVNTLAQVAGVKAINDEAYKKDTFRIIKNERKTLEDGFRLLNIHYLPSDANFYLLRLDDAQNIIDTLGEKGLLIRGCSNFRGLDSSYARVAVKSNRDNMRLLKELAYLCKA